jgi:hypothetical protein
MRPSPYYPVLQDRWERVCGIRMLKQEAGFYPPRRRRASGASLITALTAMQAKTGDSRFGAAIEAIKEHKLDQQDAGTWKNVAHAEMACVRRMLALVNGKGRLSSRHAAARVAAEYAVQGKSFDAVVKRLERAYRRLTVWD